MFTKSLRFHISKQIQENIAVYYTYSGKYKYKWLNSLIPYSKNYGKYAWLLLTRLFKLLFSVLYLLHYTFCLYLVWYLVSTCQKCGLVELCFLRFEIIDVHCPPKVGNALEKWGFGRYHTSKLDPKHTSKLCKSYLERKQSAGIMSVMEWPPQSPDLNTIELLGTGPWCP